MKSSMIVHQGLAGLEGIVPKEQGHQDSNLDEGFWRPSCYRCIMALLRRDWRPLSYCILRSISEGGPLNDRPKFI